MQRLDPGSHLNPPALPGWKSAEKFHGIPALLCLSFPRSIQSFPGIWEFGVGGATGDPKNSTPSIPKPRDRAPVSPESPKSRGMGIPGFPQTQNSQSWECSILLQAPQSQSHAPLIPPGMSQHPKGKERGKGKGQTMEVTQIPGDSGIFQIFPVFRSFRTVQRLLPYLGSGRAELPDSGNMGNSSRCFSSSRDLSPSHPRIFFSGIQSPGVGIWWKVEIPGFSRGIPAGNGISSTPVPNGKPRSGAPRAFPKFLLKMECFPHFFELQGNPKAAPSSNRNFGKEKSVFPGNPSLGNGITPAPSGIIHIHRNPES